MRRITLNAEDYSEYSLCGIGDTAYNNVIDTKLNAVLVQF